MENWEVESFIVKDDVVGRGMQVWGSFVSVRREIEGVEKRKP
jgi:hypothetical protein